MKRGNNQRRRGVTLLELLVVVTLMGILASAAAARFGPTLFGDFGSQTDARRVSLDLVRAQRMAIMSGDNHYLAFTLSGGNALGYQIFQDTGTGAVPVDEYREFTPQVNVTTSHSRAEFNFEGQALAPYQISLAGQHRSWRVNVVPVNGAVRVVEN